MEDFEKGESIQNLIKAQAYKKDGSPATFVGESFPKLVRGRQRWKVKNWDIGTCGRNPLEEKAYQEAFPPELTELEQMYKEFCEKAGRYISTHRYYSGGNYFKQIIFPDFYYDIIPKDFIVE